MAEDFPTTTLVIFGVTGDLSKRYLLPSLATICKNSDIRAKLNILGVSRSEVIDKEVLGKQFDELDSQFSSLRMDYSSQSDYKSLATKLDQLNSQQVIFYLVVPPEGVQPIVRQLGLAGLNSQKYKLLLEKPFGVNLESAQLLIDETGKYFSEDQVYRIDHYLAKEMSQNIAVFLSSNALFRDVWNNQFIEKIEVVAQEAIGIEGRVHFYEQTGAMRDFLQSHLLQLTALTIMEPCPDIFDFSLVRQRRLDSLNSLSIDNNHPFVIGQYQGYKQEVDNPNSGIETFISVTLKSSDPKWQNVPITLTTGKALDEHLTEIRVYFKKSSTAQTNLLKLRIQPKEAIELELWIKKPGYDQQLQKTVLDFAYNQYFDKLPNAYEQVIVDAVRSRANLFASNQEVLRSWEILQPIIQSWDQQTLKIYEYGSSITDVLKA